ncbi:MAG: putative lipid II flippase FtsW [bacterium]
MMDTLKEIDWSLFLVAVSLLVLGLLMVFSSSAFRAYRGYNNELYFFQRQLIWGLIGMAACLFGAVISFDTLKSLIPVLYVVILISLILVLVPFIGREAGGARRWLSFGFIGFQPSESAKLVVILISALYLTKSRLQQKNIIRDMAAVFFLVGLLVLFVVLAPDVGTALQLMGLGLIMLFLAGFPWRYLFTLAAMTVPAFAVAIMVSGYRRARIIAYINPWGDPYSKGYHILQSLRALGRGGLFGRGLGESFLKQGYLPEPYTDSIVAILGEELGFLGIMFLFGLIIYLIWRGYMISLQASDPFDRLLGLGLVALIGTQAALNLAVVSGSVPTTGIPMPFISYGGSSLVINMVAVGLLLNISRRTD